MKEAYFNDIVYLLLRVFYISFVFCKRILYEHLHFKCDSVSKKSLPYQRLRNYRPTLVVVKVN